MRIVWAVVSLVLIWMELDAHQCIEKFGIFELSLTGNNSYTNPYQEGWVTARFVSPDNDTLTIPGFWDGGNTWKVRLSPNKAGMWTYSTTSNDAGLITCGSFGCVSSDLHGGIKLMDEHPYHFQYQDGKRYWWFGETCWAGFSTNPGENLTNETYQDYVDVRASQGFNYIHCFVLMGSNDGGYPFTGSIGERVNPNFWQEVDKRIAYMNSKGITVGFLLAWKEGQWSQFEDQASRKRYCKYVASRYSADNVVWILSGEYDEEPYLDPNSPEEWTELAHEIEMNDPHDRLIGIHGGGSVEIFAATDWMSFGDYMQMYDQLHAEMLDARDHNKPVVNAEYAYFLRDMDGDGIVDKPNSATREEFRNASWEILMSGGYFVTGFGTTYAGGERDPGPFNVHASKNDPAEKDLMYMKSFFDSLQYWDLEPADGSVSGNGIHYCLREIGKQYAVYVRGTSEPIVLNLETTTLDNYIIKLYNPRTGEWPDSFFQDLSGFIILKPPDNNDWLFKLTYNYTVPVELSSFEARFVQGRVFLEWTTESETDNFGFEIQRKENSTDFESIGFIAGHGTTSLHHRYYFIDANLSYGTYFYRLKQIDKNGAFTFSAIQAVGVSLPANFNLDQNYPNPFNFATTIRYQLKDAGHISIEIYDIMAKKVRTLINHPQGAGYFSIQWDGNNDLGQSVSSGIYICQMRSRNFIETRKLVLAK